MCKGS